MDLNNHPKMLVLKTREPERPSFNVNMTTTKLSKTQSLSYLDVEHEEHYQSIIYRLGVKNALAFTTSRFMGTREDGSKLTTNGLLSDNLLASTFIPKLCKHFIGSDIDIPGDIEAGIRPGLMKFFDAIRNDTTTLGERRIHEDEISSRITTYVENEFITKDNELYLKEHHIYLPITNSDLNRGMDGLSIFKENDLANIRAAKAVSKSKSYTTIHLMDDTKFILWYNERNLGLLTGAN